MHLKIKVCGSNFVFESAIKLLPIKYLSLYRTHMLKIRMSFIIVLGAKKQTVYEHGMLFDRDSWDSI